MASFLRFPVPLIWANPTSSSKVLILSIGRIQRQMMTYAVIANITTLTTHSNSNSMMMTRKTLLTLDRKRTRLHWLERKGWLLSCHLQHTQFQFFLSLAKCAQERALFSTTNVIICYAGWFPKKLSEAENSLMITICLMNALKIENWNSTTSLFT